MPRPDAAGRTRSDRCPGVLSVHPAADGGLARVRLPGGMLSAVQLRALIAAAIDLGDGGLELTSRANVQLRALRPGSEHELSDRLYDAGLLPSLPHERVRNIVASPRTGLDHVTTYDVGPLVAEVDRRLCDSPALTELPGRFLFGLDDGRGDITHLTPDVTAQAAPEDAAAFLLSGHDTGTRLPWPTVPDLLVATAEAFLAERRAQRSVAWRIAELDDGINAILSRLNLAGSATGVGKLGISPHLATPVAGVVADVGRWCRPDGGEAAEVGVRLGLLGPDQAEVLASAAAGAGVAGAGVAGAAVAGAAAALRVTPWRSVVVPELAGDAEDWMARFGSAGLVVDPGSAWRGVTACAGRPGCASALADVRADAERVVPELAVELAAGRPVHWAGCERRCGRPPGAVDVVATGNGYAVDGAEVGPDLTRTIDRARRVAR